MTLGGIKYLLEMCSQTHNNDNEKPRELHTNVINGWEFFFSKNFLSNFTLIRMTTQKRGK